MIPLYALCPGSLIRFSCFALVESFLDSVGSLVHAINVLQIVSAARNSGYVTLGLVILLEVGLVPQVAELDNKLV